MKIAVTSATGHLGSSVVKQLIKKDHKNVQKIDWKVIGETPSF